MGRGRRRDLLQEPLGGKGANQAVAVARLGCRAMLIAKVGAEERGERMRRQLAAEGVDVPTSGLTRRIGAEALMGVYIDRMGR